MQIQSKSFQLYLSVNRNELYHNIQKGPLKLPVSMSDEAKNIIVHLLNRNPSRRLGAGADGANEIKRHPFFKGLDFDKVARREIPVPPPRYTMQQYRD